MVEKTERESGTVAEGERVSKLLVLLRSRKFWALVVGLVVTAARAYDPDFPISEAQATELVYLIVAYILGTAMEDGLQAVGGRA